MKTKYKVLAYYGATELDHLDDFDDKEDAMSCLESSLEYMQEGMSDAEAEEFAEIFWANSRIDEVASGN